jgi:TrpR family transcriptional regulator, trp operon repressor
MDTIPQSVDCAAEEISQALAHTEDAFLIRQFLLSILTPSEVGNIAARWELVKLLDQGMSQRRIAERLGLSLCKITRGSKELKKEDSAFGKMIQTYRQCCNSNDD